MFAPFARLSRALSDSVVSSSVRRLLAAACRSRRISPTLEALENRTLLSTYYVSNSGNDSNSGTSPSSPWATIGRANSATLHPGDSLLFNGGQTFSGGLIIGSNDSGSSSAPVTVGSYGTGRAKLTSNTSRGVYVFNSQYVNFQNLVVVGSGVGSASNYGFKVDSNLGNHTTLSHIYIDNCDVSGFNQYGVYFFVEQSGSWYNDVRVTNSNVHDNVIVGITSGAAALYGIENMYVGHCNAFHNTGNGSSPDNATGSGILLTAVDGGTVEYCTAYNNGTNGNGSGGIWASNSTRILMQHNEVYDNHTTGNRDGDGMGFDINTSYSILQYNYVHDNDGTGLQMDNWINNGGESNNVIRYNIAVNNGHKNSYAGLQIWGQIVNSEIYNNIVYVPSVAGAMGIKIHNVTIANMFVNNLQILNNIVVTTGGHAAVDVTSAELAGAKGLVFAGNDYFAANGSLNFAYGSKNFTSLSAFQSGTGQEMSGGKSVGFQADPQFLAVGSDPTFGDATKISSLTAYTLKSTSPLLNKAFGVASVGVAMPLVDFYGNTIPNTGVDVGADQVTSGSGGGGTGGGGTSPWSNRDIGAVGKAGVSNNSSASSTVVGSGADIFGTADAFQYDYQTLNGDGQIIAEVDSLGSANPWSKAGVMIRDGLSAGSKEVSMLVSANKKAEFERRFATNQFTATTDVNAVSPEWVKLVRQGNRFMGYISADGKTWTLVATTAVVMNSTVEIGLAVTSHDPTMTESATFSNISVVT